MLRCESGMKITVVWFVTPCTWYIGPMISEVLIHCACTFNS